MDPAASWAVRSDGNDNNGNDGLMVMMALAVS